MRIIFSVLILSIALAVGNASLLAQSEPFEEAEKNALEITNNMIARIESGEGKRDLERTKLLWEFTNVAFSEALWLDNSSSPWGIVEYIRTANDQHIGSKEKTALTGKDDTWVDTIYPQDGIPKVGVINKWNTGFAVSVGWPEYGLNSWNADLHNIEFLKRQVPVIEGILGTVLPEISAISGLEIRLIKAGSPEDKTSDFARVRIIPEMKTHLRNDFKFLYREQKVGFESSKYTILPSFFTAVAFTPDARSQVDGFFIPDRDNHIIFAACRLKPELGKKMMESLIRECLLRSLGLPQLASKYNSDSYLGAWNSASDNANMLPKYEGTSAIVQPTSTRQHQTRNVAADFTLKQFSPFDKAMISLLYCPQVRSGMDKAALISYLSNSTNCF